MGGFGQGEGGLGRGGLGEGQGTFHLPCHVLHYHMVLRPKGTSHNNAAEGGRGDQSTAKRSCPLPYPYAAPDVCDPHPWSCLETGPPRTNRSPVPQTAPPHLNTKLSASESIPFVSVSTGHANYKQKSINLTSQVGD